MKKYSYNNQSSFDKLVGRTITKVEGLQNGYEEVRFTLDGGDTMILVYEPDCCATCSIDDFSGDVDDILNTPVVVAEERTSDCSNTRLPGRSYNTDSATWSFYTIRTIKGTVDIKWLGESNGYYSETVTVYLVPAEKS